MCESPYMPAGFKGYLEDKEATGIIELFIVYLTPQLHVTVKLHAGAYREVVEPWLRQFAKDNLAVCRTFGRHRDWRVVSRKELWGLPPDLQVSMRIEFIPCPSGEGRFEYVEEP